MEDRKMAENHSFELKNRRSGRVTGVKDVHSFNGGEILLLTEAGKLLIRGEQLKVKGLNLEKGEALIDGVVNSLSYLSKKKDSGENSLIKRMFR